MSLSCKIRRFIVFSSIAGKLAKLGPDEILQYFQTELEKDFAYDDDTVIDQLQVAMEELRKAKMEVPPPPAKTPNPELPTLPFGLEIEPSIEQIIKGRNPETIDDHFKRNPHKGKAGYMKRRGLNSSLTPELNRQGSDSSSMLSSRVSEMSGDDKSSYYDTAANSRLSLSEYNSKISAQSSRTSYAGDSEIGSISGLRQTPISDEGMDGFDEHLVTAMPSRETTIENLADELRTPSVHSDYDNMENGLSNHDDMDVTMTEVSMRHEIPVEHMRQEIPVQHIPASKSDSYIKHLQRVNGSESWTDRGEDKVVEQSDVLSREDVNRLSNSSKRGVRSEHDLHTGSPRYVSKVEITPHKQPYSPQSNGYLSEMNGEHYSHSHKMETHSTSFNQRSQHKQIRIQTSQI
ncbi:hypothetical protein FSP39_017432 [Pinctada imbricata]|uniref:Uncharacterized protein n=1 Tax=Pinctada imbricata TaxID=66713 RepID=A0AA89C1Q6_PINIB|nr:hypothetical protein FSP39_017432 [Pinctada imbricata]